MQADPGRPDPGRKLPEPDPESAAHSARMCRHLRQRIEAAGGRISFGEFMHEALYAPGLGYYAAGAAKLGEAGDFVTAPEISPVFGRVLARQCKAVLDELGGGSILELGAGSGRLAVDMLGALDALGRLPDSYRILEPSPELAGRQRGLIEAELPALLPRVEWLDRLPAGHRGAMIANEVLDALPVERFRRTADGLQQAFVVAGEAGLRTVEATARTPVRDAVIAIESDLGERLPAGYVSEVCLPAPAWVADIAAALAEGMLLFCDYGLSRREYYAPDRSGGWLRCHFRHHAHDDPLFLPGAQDITAWVDFTGVAAAAAEAGLDVTGFVTQAHFLLHGGLAEELAEFPEMPLAAQLELSAQVKTLTLPGEMGERFKCLGLSRGRVATPAAFATADRSASL